MSRFCPLQFGSKQRPLGQVILLTVFLFLVHGPTETKLSPVTPENKTTISKHPKLIVISYDGFRNDYLDWGLTPILSKLRSSGVSTPYMRPRFSSKTFPNHQSLATGLHTENHGIVDNTAYDPLHGPLSGLKDHKEFFLFDERVAPIWTLNEMAGDGRASGSQFPGSVHPYGPNHTRPTHYVPYNKSRKFEARIDLVVDWLMDEKAPANLAMMYFDEPDGEAHLYGPNSPQVRRQIRRVDNMTGILIEKLRTKGILDEVNLMFLSDHGMAEVHPRNRILVSQMADPSLYTWHGGTPIINIRPKDPRDTDFLYNSFKEEAQESNFTVYRKDELPERWHYANNRRIMPIVLVADSGYYFDYNKEKFPFSKNPKVRYGSHGYDNDDPNMRAFFIGIGPAFKSGGVLVPPFENIDLFPLMCQILKLTPPPNNGTLANVAELLASESDGPRSGSTSLRISGQMGLLTLILTYFVSSS